MAKVRFEQNWIKAYFTIKTCISCIGGSLVYVGMLAILWCYYYIENVQYLIMS
jgi:hypothetical protein